VEVIIFFSISDVEGSRLSPSRNSWIGTCFSVGLDLTSITLVQKVGMGTRNTCKTQGRNSMVNEKQEMHLIRSLSYTNITRSYN
jgi:hypothetical protein